MRWINRFRFKDVKDSDVWLLQGRESEWSSVRMQNYGYHKNCGQAKLWLPQKLPSSKIVVATKILVTTKIVVKQNCGYKPDRCYLNGVIFQMTIWVCILHVTTYVANLATRKTSQFWRHGKRRNFGDMSTLRKTSQNWRHN